MYVGHINSKFIDASNDNVVRWSMVSLKDIFFKSNCAKLNLNNLIRKGVPSIKPTLKLNFLI